MAGDLRPVYKYSRTVEEKVSTQCADSVSSITLTSSEYSSMRVVSTKSAYTYKFLLLPLSVATCFCPNAAVCCQFGYLVTVQLFKHSLNTMDKAGPYRSGKEMSKCRWGGGNL